MYQAIRAIYENGVFKPRERVNLSEHQEVELVIHEDIPTNVIACVAEKAESYGFLADSEEDIYTVNDGAPV